MVLSAFLGGHSDACVAADDILPASSAAHDFVFARPRASGLVLPRAARGAPTSALAAAGLAQQGLAEDASASEVHASTAAAAPLWPAARRVRLHASRSAAAFAALDVGEPQLRLAEGNFAAEQAAHAGAHAQEEAMHEIEGDDIPFSTRLMVYMTGPVTLLTSVLCVASGYMESRMGWMLTQKAKFIREKMML
eukprot:TRINITY_DN3163_c0_g1_i1.p1 TRINITY_DN3163_c0_g1~~TRINITY_DN3163_c0_g1_i1.p1  ORF type:complete len:193 (+),score=48.20 TRINITY_DN3163_c0_g1_i1:71-649(+)